MSKRNRKKNKMNIMLLHPFRKKEINRGGNIDKCPVTSNSAEINPSQKALIYPTELEYIAKCISDYPNIETGGQLFGAWTASGAPRVIYVIGPGKRANHQTTFFNQDVEYLEYIGSRLKEYGLQHIGEWHSHHHLGLAHPSGHDVQTMQNSIAQLNLNRLLLCIGSFNNKGIIINPYNFARDTCYISAQWEVINAKNRLREVIDIDLENILHHPTSSTYIFAEEYIHPQNRQVSNQSGWFSNIENRQAFKQIIDMLKTSNWVKEVNPFISSEGIVSVKIVTRTFVEVITFPSNFPYEPFEIERMGLIEGTCNHYSFEEDWSLFSDLAQTFKHNYEQHLRNHQ